MDLRFGYIVTSVNGAAEATMAAVKAAGCESAADFLLTFKSSNIKSTAQSPHDDAAPSSFKLIIFRGALREVNPLELDDDLQWGVDALLFGIHSSDMVSLLRTLHALASIPPFKRLVLHGIEFKSREECGALYHALFSPNFSELHFCRVALHWPAENPILSSNPLLRSLVIKYFKDWVIDNLIETVLLLSLTSLTSLAILFSSISTDQIQKLFASLEESPGLITLSLRHCRLDNWPRTAILDGLRRNALLHKVDLQGTPLEGDPAIAAQLRKNKENADRLKELGSKGEERVRPSTVRLYLCGSHLSGKTTLSRSLAMSNKASLSSRLLHHTTIKLSDRTRGIEVTTLENQQEQQRISVWDMAGQIEYHSFHDSMLPDFSDRAAPPLFLYVWNPFQMDAQNKLLRNKEGRIIGLKSPDQFEADFQYWLKFIASKTLKSRMFKPKVIVATTRADLNPANIKLHLGSSFDALRKKFEEYIDIDMVGFFQVDARDSRMVFELKSYLFKCISLILSKAPQDFKICDLARQAFTNLIHSKKIPPLITKKKFSHLSRKHLGIESPEISEAVALSLSSSGDIIYFSSLELVVVDTRWFCQKIMGELLYFEMKSANLLHSKGFFPIQSLQDLLEKEINLSKHKFLWTRGASTSQRSLKVSGDVLVKLLMGLQLACEEDYGQKDSRIFIPASLCGKARDRILPSNFCQFVPECKSYVGRRWAVKDSNCTFLTPGIFPLLQVSFHKNLSKQEVRVVLDQDVMAFSFGGASVFVEFCRIEGKDIFIDVLVGSQHTLNEALQWIHENVTIKMKELCADFQGIPGVELVQFVIEPDSVQALMEAQKRRAVSVEVLQNIMSKHVQIKGATDGFESVLYTWQEDPVKHDPVMELLGEVEVAKVVEAYRGSLREAARDVLNLSDVMEERTHRTQKPTFGSSQSQKQQEAIYDLLCDVRDDVNIVKGNIKRLAGQVEGFRNVVLPKLQQMFTFVQEGEAGWLPRMFVVTQEVGNVRKLVSKVVPGLCNLRLEIICECRKEPTHLVDGQRGLNITLLEDGILKRGLPYINGFLKVAFVVTKIGAHVALGVGEAIPDFTRLLASKIDTAECEPAPNFFGMTNEWNSSVRMDFAKGQQWLFQVLSHHNCTTGAQIRAQFGLQRIRYPDSRVAWVCDKHC